MAAPAARGDELYIYYRAAVGVAPALERAALELQQGLARAHPGLQARLLRRPAARDGLHTWMEVYALPAGSDADALAAAIEAAAAVLAPWLSGPRHVERFSPCAW